jgi:autotransporter-associated beta strand protein
VQLGNTTGTARAVLLLPVTTANFPNTITVAAGADTSAIGLAHTIQTTGTITSLTGNVVINYAGISITGGGLTVPNMGLTLNGSTAGSAGGASTLSGTISSPSGAGVHVFAGNWNFTGDNTFAGGVFLDGTPVGPLGIGRDSTPTTGAVTSGPLGTGTLFVSGPGLGGLLRADGGPRTLANPISLSPNGADFGVVGVNPLTLNGPVNLNGNTGAQVLNILNAAPTTFGGVISNGTGGLTKNGPGELRLTAANTYTGPTVVNAGTLRVGGSLAAGSAVTVNPGAVLTGTGTVNGAVTVAAGGVVSPGDSPGLLTVNGGVTFPAGAVFRIEIAGATIPGGAASSGLSSGGTLGGINGAVAGAAGLDIQTGAVILVDITGATLLPDTAYSFIIGQSTGAQTMGSSFTFVFLNNGVDVTAGITPSPTLTMTGGAVNTVYINFTPVPEPAAVLAVAGLGLAAARRWRRGRAG